MATTVFKQNEIILLLGAGASVDAGIPDSVNMVRKIHDAVSEENTEWGRFRDLYRYIRSSIFYADGIDGIFDADVAYNIERFVNVLDELQKKERHTLFPFVGTWDPKLLDVAGSNFDHVKTFRNEIIDVLRKKWVVLPKKETASYYASLRRFHQEYGHPLRVFSLNYDLCVEEICGYDIVQRGFSQRRWDWRQFDETSDDLSPIFLYKLHGSIDWHFTDDGSVTYSDSTSGISNDEIALIFGTAYKLQYIDPFLFLAYELRRWTLDAARIIISLGYGFNDDHINGILGQSLRQDLERVLVAVVQQGDKETEKFEKNRILECLNAQRNQVSVIACGAKEFLANKLSIAFLSEFFPPEEDLFPEL